MNGFDTVSSADEAGSNRTGWHAAVDAMHAAGAMAVLTDPLAHFSEVERALEPLLAALFTLASAGEPVDFEEVEGELGLLDGEPDGFCPIARADPYLERAVEDGEAFREVTTTALLLSDVLLRAAAARGEWCKWESITEEDVEAPALNMDVFGAARHLSRKWFKSDPTIVAAEPALHTVLGFRAAGLPLDRSVWRYALDGARAGAEDYRLELEAEARRKAYFAERVAAAFTGESE